MAGEQGKFHSDQTKNYRRLVREVHFLYSFSGKFEASFSKVLLNSSLVSWNQFKSFQACDSPEQSDG